MTIPHAGAFKRIRRSDGQHVGAVTGQDTGSPVGKIFSAIGNWPPHLAAIKFEPNRCGPHPQPPSGCLRVGFLETPEANGHRARVIGGQPIHARRFLWMKVGRGKPFGICAKPVAPFCIDPDRPAPTDRDGHEPGGMGYGEGDWRLARRLLVSAEFRLSLRRRFDGERLRRQARRPRKGTPQQAARQNAFAPMGCRPQAPIPPQFVSCQQV